MNVPLFNIENQNASVRPAVNEAVGRILDSGQFILGPAVAQFERECASFLGAKHAIGVSSGTCALLVALEALGVGPGDEVVVPAFTYGATATAVLWAGATPVFADVDPETHNISPAGAQNAVTPGTKAMIPVHLFGRPADVAALSLICESKGIAMIEDAAQSLGASIGGRQTGVFGRIGCFSFYPTKPLGGFGDGGLLCTDDPALDAEARVIRQQGDSGGYTFVRLGGNFRLDALQAAMLSVKLPLVEKWRSERDRAARMYFEAFGAAGLGDRVRLPPPPREGEYNAWSLFVVRADRRDGLLAHLKSAGIGAGVYYPKPLHLQKAFGRLGYKQGSLPVSEKAGAEVLALPIFDSMTEGQVGAVVDAVSAFYGS